MNSENEKKDFEIQQKDDLASEILQNDITISTFIESLAEGVIIIGENGKIVLINKRWANLTFYKKEEIIGKQINIFLPENVHNKHNQHITSYFANPKMRSMGNQLELYAKKKDNSIFPVEISLSSITTTAGKFAIAFITDITRRKKAEDELMQKNIELDAYAHTVAHDLNSSLSQIVSFSELLLESNQTKEKQIEFLQTIVQSGRKMSTIIKELLIFASMNEKDIDFQIINMHELICNTLGRLNITTQQANAEIIIKHPIVNCIGYGPWIEEVWYNYITNAIKYGGSPPKIEIGCEELDNDFVKYYIKDNGLGIPPEKIETLFNEQKDKSLISLKGYGLGLNIVKRIIEKHKGSVRVESLINNGSVFSFVLKK